MAKAKTKDKRAGNGGFREGSGRPAGSGNKKTKAQRRKIAYDALVKRITEISQPLIHAQTNCALGISHLFKVERNKFGREGKATKITDEKVIADYLAGKLDNGKTFKNGKKVEYYYIASQAPDNRAIDSLLDRAYGKASQPLVGGQEDDPALQVEGFVFVKPSESTVKNKKDEATDKSTT